MFATFPRSVLKAQDMRGKPCSEKPGATQANSGCTPVSGQGHAKPAQAQQTQQTKPLDMESGRKAVGLLQDDKRIVKLPSGEIIRLADIRIKDDLSGVPKFVALLRQDAKDPNSPLVGRHLDIHPHWVQSWSQSAQQKPKPDLATPHSKLDTADRGKPYPSGSVAYDKPEDKPVLEGVAVTTTGSKPKPVVTNKPAKPVAGPTTGVAPKQPKAKIEAKHNETPEQKVIRESRAANLQPVTVRLIPKFKRDKVTGKLIKNPEGNPIPMTKPEKDKKGNPTGKRIPSKEREVTDSKGNRLPWSYQQLAGLIGPDDTHVHMNPEVSPAIRMIGPVSKFNRTIVTKAKTQLALLKSNRGKNLNRADGAIDRGDDVKLLDRFKRDSKSNNKFIKDNANLAWLITEHATRPGSDNDNKGVGPWFGQQLDAKWCKVEHLKDPKGEKKYVDKDEKIPMLKVDVSFPGADQLFTVKGEAARMLAAQIKSKKPLGSVQRWFKSYGASTLEGQHVVVDKKGNVKLQFMGKDTQWHSHGVDDPNLAAMLKERKAKAGDAGKLFGGTNETKLLKYIKDTGIRDKNGRHYVSKNLRTFKATKMARDLVKGYKNPKTKAEFTKMQKEVADKVCAKLGNKRGMVLKNYISYHTWFAWKDAAGIEEKLTYEKSYRGTIYAF